MSSGPSRSVANNGYGLAEGLDRTIRRLNANFGLRLQGPDPTYSAAHARGLELQRRTEEERRNDALYQRIRELHYQNDGQLACCLGLFEEEARRLVCNATTHDVPGFAAEERTALQLCLMGILSDLHAVNSLRWPKRLLDSISDVSSKRTRGQPDNRHACHSVVDLLPVRSRGATSSRATQGVVHPAFQHASFSSHSLASSRASFPSDVFSSTYAEDAPPSSQTTVESDCPDYVTNKLYPACAEANQALEEPLARNAETTGMEASLDLHDKSFERSSLCNPRGFENSWASHGSTTAGPGMLSKDFSQANGNIAIQTLEDRLANIWPKFPSPGLNEAPLAIIWEVTRAALHCGVDLDGFDLKYEPDDGWHEQAKWRNKLLTHHLFTGKELPPSSDSIAWQIACNEFQSKVKAVTLSAELVYSRNVNGPLYDLCLLPLKLELGHRLARRFGADRFLEVLIPSPSSAIADQPDLLKSDERGLDKIVWWLTKKRHYFLGRVWVPFFLRNVKGKKSQNPNKKTNSFQDRVYFFAYEGNNFRMPPTRGSIPPQDEAWTPGKRTKLKLGGLLEWAVAIGRSSHQPVTKLFSRLALSLSRTWPTVVLERSQIRIRDKDVGTHKVMNDGIGCMSRSLAEKIAKCLGLSDCPSCFQARLGSAKGMWIIDVQDVGLDDDDWIEIYPSQKKWECDFQDPHHRTFEVRNWPSELKSASLNQQFIPVLEAQSIDPAAMRQVIAEHLRGALLADLDAQTAAMKEPMDLRLWVQQSGLQGNGRSCNGYAQFLAGLPDSNVDKVTFLLDSGFDQRKMRYLKDLVWDMCKRKAEVLKSKMNISIPCSAYVYMVADFSSTLEEGEVHLSFSTKFQVEGFSDTLLENMDVLVARAPAHLPSDIQRVRVVSRPELRKLKDVIVFSTKGKTPLADILSGGDYDGDMAWVCWDRNIVNNFCSAAVPAAPDLFKLGYLQKSSMKFQDIWGSSGNSSQRNADTEASFDHACRDFIFEAVHFNLQASFLGKCTKYKERLCYHENSVKNKPAIVLSTLLGHLVDQSKQGVIFSFDDWKRLCTGYLKKNIFQAEPEYAKERGSSRPRPDGRLHVLDYLRFQVASVVIEEALVNFDKAINTSEVTKYDQDLTLLYNTYDGQAKTSSNCRKLLKHVRDEITGLAELWRKSTSTATREEGNSFTENVKQLYQKWLNIKPPSELLSSDLVQEALRDCGEDSTMSRWELLKASTAFKHHYNSTHKFVWYMAGKQLAFIKARMHLVAKETASVLVIPEMWGVLRPDKKLIKSLAAQREIAKDSESVTAIEEVMEFDDNGTVIDDA